MADESAKSYLIRILYWYSGVFGVVDYESKLRIQKFKIADPIWPTKLSPEIVATYIY